MQQSNLNLIPLGDMPIIYASQYDNNRVIRFNLFDGEDEYTLSGTETVKCNIRKNDEHIVVIVPTIGANKYIDVYLTEQACACFGDNIGEITISSGEDNIIGTINFILKVERNPIQGGVTSASDIADLESQIEDIVHEVMSDDYYTRDEVDAKLDLKADASSVYTKSEVDTALASKANAADVYTKSQVDSALGLKADKSDTYTKSQVDTALASKADASSVYTKSEVDTTLALKANAADVYTKTEVDEMIDELYPINTASGSIAHFTTSLAKPLTELSSTIVAQQASGTPTPSSPLPISGFSSVKFVQTGKNLFDKNNLIDGKTISSDGSITDSTYAKLTDYIPIINGKCTFSAVHIAGTAALRLGLYDENKNFISREISSVGTAGSLTTLTINNSNAKFVRANLYTTGENVDTAQVELGTTATSYEAYTGDTFTIALGQTVYGGSVDAKNGKATITHQIVNLGSLDWTYRSDNKLFLSGTITSAKAVNNTAVCDALCEIYVANSRDNIWNDQSIENSFAINNNSKVLIRDTRYTDATNFKTAMNGQMLVYELATPVEITGLTPDNFTAIAGEQNIFSDCGVVSIGFKQEIQDYIDSKIGG